MTQLEQQSPPTLTVTPTSDLEPGEIRVGQTYCVAVAFKLDAVEFTTEAARCTFHVLVCYVILTFGAAVVAGCVVDPALSLTTGVVVAGTRLFGDDVSYFTRTRKCVRDRRYARRF